MTLRLRLPFSQVLIHPEQRMVESIFADGKRGVGTREDTQENRDEARDQGYVGEDAVWCSLRDHETIHHLIPLWLWDSASPTLRHEMGGERCPYYDRLFEEALVIGFQFHVNTGSVPRVLLQFTERLPRWRARYADALLRMEEIAA